LLLKSVTKDFNAQEVINRRGICWKRC